MPEANKDAEGNGKTYFDTFLFMDMLSGNPELASRAEAYLKNFRGVVSSILFTELAFHISRKSKKTSEILFYIQCLPIEIVPVDEEIARLAGVLRARYRGKIEKKLTYFDCIHLATALQTKCKKFITGDRGFREIKEIEIEIY